MNVLICGATGFVGTYLVKHFLDENSNVTILARNTAKAIELFKNCSNVDVIEWNINDVNLDLSGKNITHVINLMGENVAQKVWTNERKKQLYNSRVDGTQNLLKILEKNNFQIEKFVQITATGIYKDSELEIREGSEYSDSFLGKLCQDWEEKILLNQNSFKNFTILRLGMVIGKNGGAMAKILPAFNFFVGGNLGNGKQMMSWIHVHDLCNLINTSLTNDSYSGIINAVSPYNCSNAEFTKSLSELLRKPAVFHVPKLALKTILGEMSEILLANQNIKSDRLKEEKFIFKYPTIENALKEVVSK